MRRIKRMYKNLIEEAKRQDINRHVVGALVAKDSTILLLKRSKDDFMGGIYELPSGKVKSGETLDSALCREMREETNLRIKEIKNYLGYFDYKSKDGGTTRQFNFVVTVQEPLEIRLREHDKYAWLDKNQLNQYLVTDSVKHILDLFWGAKNEL